MKRLRKKLSLLLYAGGRLSTAFSQIVIAAFGTRYLTVDELAAFAIGIVFAMLSSTLGNPNIRRLVVDHWSGGRLTGIKAATLLMNAIVLALSVVVAFLIFDRNVAIAALGIGGWRFADNYAEIGIGVRLHRSQSDLAGLGMLVRAIVGSAPPVILFYMGNFHGGLMAGAITRLCCCIFETEIAAGGNWGWAEVRAAWKIFGFARGYASATVTCMAFDAVPTLVFSKFAPQLELALLAPLGRVRTGLVLLGTVAMDLAYPRLQGHREQWDHLSRFLRVILIRVVGGALLISGILLAGVAQLVFGPLLAGSRHELAAVCLAAVCSIMATTVSSALTSLGRLRFQSWIFALAAVAMAGFVCVSHLSITEFYVAQAGIMFVAFITFWFYAKHTFTTGQNQKASQH